MALTYSKQVALGTPIPEFKLPAVDGKTYSVKDFAQSKVLVMMFICNHCPYVQAIEDRILKLAHDYTSKGVQFVGICTNDPTDYPEDSFENLKAVWKQKRYDFPYCVDESQKVAHAFQAVCTPDIFVYDEEKKLAYCGRLDDSWQDPSKVTREDLREAIDSLLAKEKPSEEQIPSMGCSIKWRR